MDIDGATFLRAVRFALGRADREDLMGLPAIISAAARGRISAELESIVGNEPAVCLGYRPVCRSDSSLGAYLSVFCPESSSSADPVQASPRAASDPYQALLAANPYVAACALWRVDAAGADANVAMPTNVPILIMTGQFDAFSALPVASEAAKGFDHAFVLEIPTQAHNVLGASDCPIGIRNAWVRDPTSSPDITCLKGMPPIRFSGG